LRINDFIALIVAQRKDYVNNNMTLSFNTTLQIRPTVYVGGVPQYVTLPEFTDNTTV